MIFIIKFILLTVHNPNFVSGSNKASWSLRDSLGPMRIFNESDKLADDTLCWILIVDFLVFPKGTKKLETDHLFVGEGF